jgi:hypothetical protein
MSELTPKMLEQFEIDWDTCVYLEEIPTTIYKLWIVTFCYEDGNECNCVNTHYFDSYAEAVKCYEDYKKDD